MNNCPNPLEIPEILSRIGLYIPLWTKRTSTTATAATSPRTFRPVFSPQHLHSCILVSHLWHECFLPILWFTFDDTSPRSTTPTAIANLSRHHVHFRILELSRLCPSIFTFPLLHLPHNLIHLDLSGLDSNEWTKALVLQNPRLQSLHWQGGDFHRDDYGTLDGLALSKRLHSLQELHLECWKIDKGFMALLRRNPSLRRISLDFVTGDFEQDDVVYQDTQRTSVDTTTAPSSSSSSLHTSITRGSHDAKEDKNEDDDDEEEDKADVTLPNLTSLTVCKDVGSGALEALVRLCPRLEELSWMGSHDGDLRSLASNIQQCCPSLSALTYSTVEVVEGESAYADLVGGLSGLVELQIRIPCLGNLFSEALVKHATTLEVLDLRIQPDRGTDTDTDTDTEKRRTELRRILEGCHQITALSIEGSSAQARDLFTFNWGCLRLHRLFLSGLHPLTRGHPHESDNSAIAARYGWTNISRIGNEGSASLTTTGRYDAHGVEVVSGIGTGVDVTMVSQYGLEQLMARKVSTSFLRGLLLHVQSLSHMQSFILNGVEYARTSDHLGHYSG